MSCGEAAAHAGRYNGRRYGARPPEAASGQQIRDRVQRHSRSPILNSARAPVTDDERACRRLQVASRRRFPGSPRGTIPLRFSRPSLRALCGLNPYEHPRTSTNTVPANPSVFGAFARIRGFSKAIGAPRFELGTSPTRTVRATRLRHAPKSHGESTPSTHRAHDPSTPATARERAYPPPEPAELRAWNAKCDLLAGCCSTCAAA